MVAILLADGFEEMEAIITADILGRGGLNVVLVDCNSNGTLKVKSARNIEFCANILLSDITDLNDLECVVTPGGMGGTKNLAKNPLVIDLLKKTCEKEKIIASICASPVVVLGKTGILKNKKFTCYPGMEEEFSEYGGLNYKELIQGSVFIHERVVVDDNLITSQGPGTTPDFALTILEKIAGKEITCSVAKGALFSY